MTPQQQPLLRDLIDIPESVSTSDFVLKLADAVTSDGAAEALNEYVVTDGLRENFKQALSLIKTALDGHSSKAAYLHGSFGAGKSHFMAVLHALLSGSPEARAMREFDPVLTEHEWLGTDGRKFLLVPYHMLGAKSLEQRVLGGYVAHVRKLHPDVPTPQVYRTDAMFESLTGLRESMGDDAVISALAKAPTANGESAEDEWGEAFAWSVELLDRAMGAEEEHEVVEGLDLVNPSAPAELRARLVEDAGATLLRGFFRDAAEDEHGFISLDAGLAVIAEHAKALGYGGLVLFLDELILWLATLIHEEKLVAREAGKITNFVEGGDARRAIPVVSFIARQRDLRELVGEEVSGAAEASIQDTLNLASGRFETIDLEDRNLPQIAHARVLKPKDAEADAKIVAAFEQTKRLGPNVWDTLLGSDKGTTGADEQAFRLTYPFSPAFMDTLVHISSALQRSRTGLKLMRQLLVDHRDELRLGQLVPVGDLYPLIARGGERPFVDNLKVVFAAADKLYRDKLRPWLLATNQVTEEDVERYLHRPAEITDIQLQGRARAFLGDTRLIHTLLLSALAPSVPALSDLTLRKLGALNHGSVLAPFPGAEVGILKNKVAEWAAQFPEIKETGTDANPGVRLELSGVDVDSVIANANVNDNANNRIALAKKLLTEELGLEPDSGRFGGAQELSFVWRGSQRTAEVLFTNIADTDQTAEHDLQPLGDDAWRIIVDLPFEEGEYGPRDDLNRLQGLRERQGDDPVRTAAWLPTHLSAALQRDFRKLVVIDKALADPQRFDSQYAVHLNPDNRERAKGLLTTQKASLEKKIKGAFREAYGLAQKQEGNVELGFDDHFASLQDVPELKPQIGQSMKDALRHLAGKLLAHQYPAHPNLNPDNPGSAVTPSDAKTVFTHAREAAESRDGRVEIPAKDRKVMARIAGPLGLGTMKEAYFELNSAWRDHFNREARNAGVTGDISLVKLMDWLDRPEPRGLEKSLARLVSAAYAEMADMVWVRGGVPLNPAPEPHQLKEQDALREQPLPEAEAWDEARRRFEVIFGAKAPQLRRGRIVNQFARQISQATRQYAESAAALVRELEQQAGFLHLRDADDENRLAIARHAQELLTTLAAAATGSGQTVAKKTVEALAAFELEPVGADRIGTSVKTADKVAGALATAGWEQLALAEDEGAEGQALLASLRATAKSDQRTADLVEGLRHASSELTAVIRRNRRAAGADPAPPSVAAPAPGPDDVSLVSDTSHPAVPTTPPAGDSGPGPRRSGAARTRAASAVDELRGEMAALAAFAAEHPDAEIEFSWRVVD